MFAGVQGRFSCKLGRLAKCITVQHNKCSESADFTEVLFARFSGRLRFGLAESNESRRS